MAGWFEVTCNLSIILSYSNQKDRLLRNIFRTVWCLFSEYLGYGKALGWKVWQSKVATIVFHQVGNQSDDGRKNDSGNQRWKNTDIENHFKINCRPVKRWTSAKSKWLHGPPDAVASGAGSVHNTSVHDSQMNTRSVTWQLVISVQYYTYGRGLIQWIPLYPGQHAWKSVSLWTISRLMVYSYVWSNKDGKLTESRGYLGWNTRRKREKTLGLHMERVFA